MSTKANFALVVLLGVTLAMQGTILYLQYDSRKGTRTSVDPVRNAPRSSVLDLKGLPLRGNREAKVVLVEFSDYECPFCERYALGVGKVVEKNFISSGSVQHAFVNNPLPNHSNAVLLASAAICAGDQNRYWEMHDILFEKKPRSRDEIISIVEAAKYDIPKFLKCLDHDEEPAKRISLDRGTAQRLNLSATPAFALGWLDSSGLVRVEKLIIGSQPLQILDKAIKDLMREMQ